MTNQVEYIPIAKEKQETPLQAARRRFEYWYGHDDARALFSEIATLPTDQQIEMIYREMEYREGLAIRVEQNQVYEDLTALRGFA